MPDRQVSASTAAQPKAASFHFIATVLQLMEEASFFAFSNADHFDQDQMISGHGKYLSGGYYSAGGIPNRLACLAVRCPLWVISGHVQPQQVMSALPPIADINRDM